MTIDDDNIISTTIERVEEEITDLLDDDWFLDRVLDAAGAPDTTANRNLVKQKIREAAEAVATM